MHNKEEVNRVLSNLQEETVCYRRTVCNTIILYFFGVPGDNDFATIRINPSWRYSISNRILVGSGDVPDREECESREEYRKRFNEICDINLPIVGSKVKRISMDTNSTDLLLEFSDKQKLVSFASYTDSECWYYTDRKNGIRIIATSIGCVIEQF